MRLTDQAHGAKTQASDVRPILSQLRCRQLGAAGNAADDLLDCFHVDKTGTRYENGLFASL